MTKSHSRNDGIINIEYFFYQFQSDFRSGNTRFFLFVCNSIRFVIFSSVHCNYLSYNIINENVPTKQLRRCTFQDVAFRGRDNFFLAKPKNEKTNKCPPETASLSPVEAAPVRS